MSLPRALSPSAAAAAIACRRDGGSIAACADAAGCSTNTIKNAKSRIDEGGFYGAFARAFAEAEQESLHRRMVALARLLPANIREQCGLPAVPGESDEEKEKRVLAAIADEDAA